MAQFRLPRPFQESPGQGTRMTFSAPTGCMRSRRFAERAGAHLDRRGHSTRMRSSAPTSLPGERDSVDPREVRSPDREGAARVPADEQLAVGRPCNDERISRVQAVPLDGPAERVEHPFPPRFAPARRRSVDCRLGTTGLPHRRRAGGCAHDDGIVGPRKPQRVSAVDPVARPRPAPALIGAHEAAHAGGRVQQWAVGQDDVHVVLADGPLLYATTGMGCFVSPDEGWRWSWASDGIDRGYTLGLAWTDDAVVVSAASGPPSMWEAGGPEAAIYRSSSRGSEPRWERVFDAFGGAVERNCLHARDALVVAGTTDGELLISRDAGRTFTVGRSDLPGVNAVALAG